MLEIVKLTQDQAFLKARAWWFANLPEDPPMKLEEFESRFPGGSEGSEAFEFIAAHFETMGVLMKHGLLNEDLYFDRYFVEPYWASARAVVKARRARWHPDVAENFAWLARRAEAWRRKQARKGR